MDPEAAAHEVAVLRQGRDGARPGARALPVEAPVAIEVNGLGYAVMMATPSDLEDFGTGFALTERLIGGLAELETAEAVELERGWLLRLIVRGQPPEALQARVRRRVSESSCGLCGVENLEQALRPLPRLAARPAPAPQAIYAALEALREHQPLNALTGAVHAAALCDPDGAIRLAREDVGRHNALDKLVGAALRAGAAMSDGFVLLSSRCSYELVEKAVLAGAGGLVTVSAATSLAVERAAEAGLRLVSLARPDEYLLMTP